jgi:hypothetical protein
MNKQIKHDYNWDWKPSRRTTSPQSYYDASRALFMNKAQEEVFNYGTFASSYSSSF